MAGRGTDEEVDVLTSDQARQEAAADEGERPQEAERAAASDAGAARVNPLLRAGRYAWALLGVLLVGWVLGIIAVRLTLLIVPVVLALFPAALLSPVARWLKRHRIPGALASILVIVGTFAIIVMTFAALVPVVAAEVPALVDSVSEGVGQIENLLTQLPFGPQIEGIDELIQRAREQLGQAEGLGRRALEAAATAFEGVAGFLLLVVALFFYLKDGERIGRGVRDTLPRKVRHHAEAIGARVWTTLGSYFRGQLLIALVDAVFIGLGLLLLGVPLALPLAVLVFFGGLFPIVGAVVTGAVAVLVALADSGLVPALVVLGLVVAVQQIEGNVLEPLILSRAIAIHPLLVIVSITAGAVTFGILGAFLAVPVAASIARTVDYLRQADLRADTDAVVTD